MAQLLNKTCAYASCRNPFTCPDTQVGRNRLFCCQRCGALQNADDRLGKKTKKRRQYKVGQRPRKNFELCGPSCGATVSPYSR